MDVRDREKKKKIIGPNDEWVPHEFEGQDVGAVGEANG
jgi:hypothetical protein